MFFVHLPLKVKEKPIPITVRTDETIGLESEHLADSHPAAEED